MADLSEIPENDIKSLERAMRVFGVSGITVDGNPDDITSAQLIPFLDKVSRAFGETGTAFAQGDEFVAGDFASAENFEQRIDEISAGVAGFRDSPHLGLVREILADSPDYTAIEGHLTAIGIPRPADVAQQIQSSLGWLGANTVLNHETRGVIATAEANDPNFAKLREILGDQAIENIDQTIAVMNQSDSWMRVVEAFKPTAPLSTAEVDALEAEVEVAQATVSEATTERIKAVETILGIDPPDGVWGAGEQQALKTRIAEMQQKDPTWVGRKDGVYTPEFGQYVLGEISGYDHFNDADKAFFQHLVELRLDNVPIVSPEDEPKDSAAVLDAIAIAEKGLLTLVPIVQGELDQRREDALKLIDSINGSEASAVEVKAATDQLLRISQIQGPLTPEDMKIKEEAQEVIDQSGFADDIGNFIDDFGGLGYTSGGHRLVQWGKEWSVDMIRGQLAGYHDLPDVDSFKLDDGRLDINEQRALQGVTFLLAEKLGIAGDKNWHYTPELGQALLGKLDKLDDDEKLLLLSDAQREKYNQETDEAARKVFLDKAFAAKKDEIVALLAALDTLYEAGVLVPQRLYFAEEIEIPPLTQTIFDEYMHGVDNPFVGEAREPATVAELNMLNVMVYEYTQGMDLTEMMDEGYDFPHGIEKIDPTQTIAQRFKDCYEAGIDTDEMLKMLDILPFGSDERRAQMKVVVQSANDAVKKAKEADPDVSLEVLAALYGNAMEAGLNAMNADPVMHSDYLFIAQRPLSIDPRLEGMDAPIDEGSSITVGQVLEMDRVKNNDFVGLEGDYEPTFFKDGDDIYVVAIDYLSQMRTIQKVDLEAWDAVVAATPKKPGEAQRAYDVRLDEALSSVSGHDLIFQNNFEDDKQATLIYGTSPIKLPDLLRGRDIQSFDVVNDGIVADKAAEREAARDDIARSLPAVGPKPTDQFNGAAGNGPVTPVMPSDPLTPVLPNSPPVVGAPT